VASIATRECFNSAARYHKSVSYWGKKRKMNGRRTEKNGTKDEGTKDKLLKKKTIKKTYVAATGSEAKWVEEANRCLRARKVLRRKHFHRRPEKRSEL
jgi:hypothetical protein